MTKIAAVIAGVLLLAGAALAGTVTSLGSAGTPTIGSTPPPASVTVRQEDRAREREARGRAAEPGEDVRHQDRVARAGDDHGRHRRGHDHRGGEHGHGGGDD
jgi:hypothetical protein